MNNSAWVPWLIGGLAVALAVVSAVAGALWGRVRSLPMLRVAQLSRELAERQRALEELLLRLERGSRGKVVELPTRPGMIPPAPGEVPPLSPTLPHEGGGGRKVAAGPDGAAVARTLTPNEGGGRKVAAGPEGEAAATHPSKAGGGRSVAGGAPLDAGATSPPHAGGVDSGRGVRADPTSPLEGEVGGEADGWGGGVGAAAGLAGDPAPVPGRPRTGGGDSGRGVRVNPTSPLEGEVGGEADGWGGGAPTSAGAAIAARRATAASRRADGAHPTPPGPTLIAVPDLATPAATGGREAVTTPAAEELQRRHGAVWELADAGARVEQIAAHLGMPPGHVELILGLRRPLAGGTAGR